MTDPAGEAPPAPDHAVEPYRHKLATFADPLLSADVALPGAFYSVRSGQVDAGNAETGGS